MIKAFPLRRSSQFGIRQNGLKGPSRVVRLCLLGILLPALLIAAPLYLRYRVYSHQLYPLAMTDMRIIDGRVSTTWCQRQLVRANTTFNAYLLEDSPKISERLEPLSMVRHLVLEDDMKEYWGFYLLKGSIVRVSTCVRWPGASLIVIRGHKHLHECAYIGDNSSEEDDEEAQRKEDGPANRPDEMRRHRPDVQFLKPDSSALSTNRSLIEHPSNFPDEDISDTDGDIRKILDNLQNKTKNAKKGKNEKHIHRNSTVQSAEKKNVEISPPRSDITSEELMADILVKLEKLGDKKNTILDKLKKFATEELAGNGKDSEIVNRKKRQLILATADLLKVTDEEQDNVAREEGFNPDGIADHRGRVMENAANDMSNSEFWSSFSSSEEALLSCTGLILNLPLTPHHKCAADLSNDEAEEAYLMNTIIYKVPLNGYYFFVFNSENEVQQNYLRVQFNMEKTVYDVSKPVAACSNVSSNCSLDLRFLSSQKVVLELPLQTDDFHFNEEFVAESECEPRSALYALCVIAVPVVFIIFAFT